MELVARPIDTWPGLRPLRSSSDRVPTRFKASWEDTRRLLVREAGYLAGSDGRLILQLAITERECRQDRWIRSDARPDHPGVIVTFTDELTGEPMKWACDTFDNRGWAGYLNGWKSNVRAIALTLQRLRSIEEYGIGTGREQYVGWQAISAESATPLGAGVAMTREEAARVIIDAAHYGVTADQLTLVLTDAPHRDAVYKVAARNTHPDTDGGDEAAFKLVSTAKAVLDGKL